MCPFLEPSISRNRIALKIKKTNETVANEANCSKQNWREQHVNLLMTAGKKKSEQDQGKKFANESAPSL